MDELTEATKEETLRNTLDRNVPKKNVPRRKNPTQLSPGGKKYKARKRRRRKKRSFSPASIVEMFLALLTIPVGLVAARSLEEVDPKELAILMETAFLLLSMATLLRAVARRYRTQIAERRKLDFVLAGVFFACAVMVGIKPTMPVMAIAGAAFMLSLIPGRILSIRRVRRWFSILFNVAFIVVVLLLCWDFWTEGEYQLIFVVGTMLLLAMQSLIRIMSVTFARLRLDLLRNIVQKTYAAEIIFGLLLLIASFSFVLLYSDSESFNGDYANALWYCFAVVTTIGFGDMTAVSPIGRILSVALGIYGIIVVALITSIIVNFYGEMKKSRPEDDEYEQIPEAEPAESPVAIPDKPSSPQ